MNGEPIEDDGVGREPTGSEVLLVEAIRARRAAESEATALRNRLLKMSFTRDGLAMMVDRHRQDLKREVVGKG